MFIAYVDTSVGPKDYVSLHITFAGLGVAAAPEDETLEDVLAELKEQVGLERVKFDVSSIVKLMQTVRMRQEAQATPRRRFGHRSR
jgi:hypothetical protein